MKQEQYTMISQEVINKNNLNGVYYLGKLMELINAFRPNSIEEWEHSYCSWARQTGQDKKITEAIDRAFNICLQRGIEVSREEVREVFWGRTIRDCWIGRERELKCADWIREKGFRVETVSDEIDREYGVDLIVYDNEGNILLGVQVKGVAYFYRNENRERDVINPKKYNKFKKEMGARVIEVGYNNDGELSHNKASLEVALGLREVPQYDCFNF